MAHTKASISRLVAQYFFSALDRDLLAKAMTRSTPDIYCDRTAPSSSHYHQCPP